ncbi:pyridoxal-phosphate-dependent aminotransferase family protein [Tautonia sociabilis]|uniref:Alanine--glyoxylate aminotransferase family protein n=1 Tax=Tautonia sociabilis TaxID=2080755 RepID=A0A432MG34_9BACT|nr:alanine--glyoxylate aminotransferase family protein [Tautonia sociabilis]RUL85537.1 alanine--glyoxylate aminotransferase family protein [Tautonia sociabilis]
MRKPRLMAPGPAPVPEEVLLEMARPVIHSRDPRTKQAIKEAIEGLREVLKTANDVAILAATGTGAMEAAVIHAVPPGKKALVLNAGWFGLRWAKICQAHGIPFETIDVEWGQPVDPARVAEALTGRDDIAVVCGTLSETSTGTGHPIEAIGKVVAETAALFAVDGISGVGAMECRTDDWKIDLLAVGSQKALMLPPGLAFVAVSPKAWAVIDSFEPKAFYFSLKAARKKLAEWDTPYTPAHTLIFGLVKSLERIKAEGIENVWARHKTMSDACQAGVKALGLELFSARPAEGLTAFVVPQGLKDTDIRKKLDDRFGLSIVGGQDKLKGKICRIGHMGYNDEVDVVGALAALEMVLAELGHEFEPGAGVSAAQRVLIGQGSPVGAA